MAKHAFRCKNCGRLHAGEHAGTEPIPTACTACGRGVRFGPTGNKSPELDNWEVLADATPDRLAELGLTAEEVERYAPPAAADDLAADIARAEGELASLEAKCQTWEREREQNVAAYKDLLPRHLEASRLAESAPPGPGSARAVEERERLAQQLRALEALEWSQRDREHKAHIEAELDKARVRLAQGSRPRRPPRSVFAEAREGVSPQDRAG